MAYPTCDNWNQLSLYSCGVSLSWSQKFSWGSSLGAAEESILLRMCVPCHATALWRVLALHAFSCCLWRSNLSLDLQQEVQLVAFYLSPCAKRPQTARRFVSLVWVAEIRKSMSGVIRMFHLRIHSETAWRHLYTSHCILYGCTCCYKPFIVSRVSLLPKCWKWVHNPFLSQPNTPRCQCVLGTGDYWWKLSKTPHVAS